MAKNNNSEEEQLVNGLLKEKYRAEYRTLAEGRTSFFDRFRSAESRNARIEKATEKMLDRAIRNGTLQARVEEELGAAAENHTPATKAPLASQPGTFDFLGMGDKPAENVPSKSYEGEYKITIPNATALKAAPAENFLGYVLDTLDRYNIKSPGFIAVEEMRPRNAAKPVPAAEKGQLLGTFIKKKFNIVSGSGGLNVERKPEVTDTLLVMHSNVQESFINTAAAVITAYNDTGEIGQNLRERFIFEQTRDELRNASYAKTKQYEDFCMQALAHVMSKMETLGLLTQQQQNTSGAYLDTRPPLYPTKITASFSFDPGKKK